MDNMDTRNIATIRRVALFLGGVVVFSIPLMFFVFSVGKYFLIGLFMAGGLTAVFSGAAAVANWIPYRGQAR